MRYRACFAFIFACISTAGCSALDHIHVHRVLDPITRTDVPKQRLHVFRLPQLEKLKEADTDINVTAYLDHVPHSFYFKVSRGQSKEPAYYQLDEKKWCFFPLISKPSLTAEMQETSPARKFRIELENALKPERLIIFDGDKELARVAAKPRLSSDKEFDSEGHLLTSWCVSPIDSEGSPIHVFNHGRSLVYSDWADLHVISNVFHPEIVKYPDLVFACSPHLCGDPESDSFFLIKKTGSFTAKVAKFEHGRLKLEGDPFSAGFEQVVYDKESNCVFIARTIDDTSNNSLKRNRGVGEVVIVDGANCKLRGRFAVAPELVNFPPEFLGKIGANYLALFGPEIVDLKAAKIVANLPYSKRLLKAQAERAKYSQLQEPSSSQDSVLSADLPAPVLHSDKRMLLYADYDTNRSGSLKIVAYDLEKFCQVSSVLLSTGLKKPETGCVFSINLLPQGDVLALSGTQSGFLNQEQLEGTPEEIMRGLILQKAKSSP